MIVELTVINSLPVKEDNSSIAGRIPQRIFQKKLFNTDNMLPEQYVNSIGKVEKRYSVVKEGNEYFKLDYPYEKLVKDYYHLNTLVIGGFHAKRNTNTNV